MRQSVGLVAVLSQMDAGGQENPIAYASRKLQPRERNYSTIEKECLWALKIFYMYLYGKQFEIQTDHQPLSWLQRMKNLNALKAGEMWRTGTGTELLWTWNWTIICVNLSVLWFYGM